jgi:hypothetical protein
MWTLFYFNSNYLNLAYLAFGASGISGCASAFGKMSLIIFVELHTCTNQNNFSLHKIIVIFLEKYLGSEAMRTQDGKHVWKP